MAKYGPLVDRLMATAGDSVDLTFDEVRGLVGDLPPSAYSRSEWWANDSVGHVQSIAWLGAGWRVRRADLREQRVIFERINGARAPIVSPESADASGIDPAPEALRALGREYARAIGDGDSVFTPGRAVWTAAHAQELVTSFVERPDEGGRTFGEKVDDQLRGVSDDGLQLFAEIWYLNLAPLADYAAATKRQLVEGILGKMSGPVTLPPLVDSALVESAFNGGVAFKTRRPFQLALLIKLAGALLELPEPARQAALNVPLAWQELLTSIPEPNEPAQRRAVSWLLFPDYFLSVVSERHRAAIRNAFVDRLDGNERDLDEELYKIRESLAEQYGSGSVYESPILDAWDPGRSYRSADVITDQVTKRAWLVRGNSVNGRDLVPAWRSEGWVSLAATNLRAVAPGMTRDELKPIVDEDYAHAS